MATCTVTGTIEDPNGVAIVGEYVYFRLKNAGTDDNASTVYPRDNVSAVTDSNGQFTETLWVNGDSGVSSVYEILLPGQERVDVVIPSGTSAITLDTLLSTYRVTSTSQPSVSGFLRVSDVGGAAYKEVSFFQERSERNQASGYAGLNSSGLLDASVLPSYFASGGTEFSQVFSGDYVSGGTTT